MAQEMIVSHVEARREAQADSQLKVVWPSAPTCAMQLQTWLTCTTLILIVHTQTHQRTSKPGLDPLRLEVIKLTILARLGLSRAPNVTGGAMPSSLVDTLRLAHALPRPSGRRTAPQPVVVQDDSPQTQQIISFAEPGK